MPLGVFYWRNVMFNNRLFKISAWIALCAFTYSSVLHQPLLAAVTMADDHKRAEKLEEQLQSFALPYKYGRFMDGAYFNDDKLVIFVQDLHCHAEVQKNIYEIIKLFDTRCGIDKILVEGAPAGKVDISPLGSIPDEKMKKNALNRLLNSGLIGGAEYYSVVENRDKLYGLEQWDVYKKNLARVRSLIEEKGRNAILAQRLEQRTKRLKAAYLSPSLRGFERALKSSGGNGKLENRRYLALERLGKKAGEDIADYPNLSAYVRLLKLNGEINYRRLPGELSEYMAGLKKVLPYSVYKTLLDKFERSGADEDYYLALSRIADEYTPQFAGRYRNAARFLKYIRLNYAINPVCLVSEESAFCERALSRKAAKPADEEILFLSRMSEIFSAIADLKVTTADFDYFRDNAGRFRALVQKYIPYAEVKGALSLLNDEELFAFYETNLRRNDIFVENIVAAVGGPAPRTTAREGYGATLERMDSFKRVNIVISGGFHSEIVKALKNNNISCLAITPNVTRNFDDKVYEKAITQRITPQDVASSAFGVALINVLVNGGLDNNEAAELVNEELIPALIADAGSIENGVNAAGRWIEQLGQNNAGIAGLITIDKTRRTISFGGEAWKFVEQNGLITLEKQKGKNTPLPATTEGVFSRVGAKFNLPKGWQNTENKYRWHKLLAITIAPFFFRQEILPLFKIIWQALRTRKNPVETEAYEKYLLSHGETVDAGKISPRLLGIFFIEFIAALGFAYGAIFTPEQFFLFPTSPSFALAATFATASAASLCANIASHLAYNLAAGIPWILDRTDNITLTTGAAPHYGSGKSDRVIDEFLKYIDSVINSGEGFSFSEYSYREKDSDMFEQLYRELRDELYILPEPGNDDILRIAYKIVARRTAARYLKMIIDDSNKRFIIDDTDGTYWDAVLNYFGLYGEEPRRAFKSYMDDLLRRAFSKVGGGKFYSVDAYNARIHRIGVQMLAFAELSSSEADVGEDEIRNILSELIRSFGKDNTIKYLAGRMNWNYDIPSEFRNLPKNVARKAMGMAYDENYDAGTGGINELCRKLAISYLEDALNPASDIRLCVFDDTKMFWNSVLENYNSKIGLASFARYMRSLFEEATKDTSYLNGLYDNNSRIRAVGAKMLRIAKGEGKPVKKPQMSDGEKNARRILGLPEDNELDSTALKKALVNNRNPLETYQSGLNSDNPEYGIINDKIRQLQAAYDLLKQKIAASNGKRSAGAIFSFAFLFVLASALYANAATPDMLVAGQQGGGVLAQVSQMAGGLISAVAGTGLLVAACSMVNGKILNIKRNLSKNLTPEEKLKEGLEKFKSAVRAGADSYELDRALAEFEGVIRSLLPEKNDSIEKTIPNLSLKFDRLVAIRNAVRDANRHLRRGAGYVFELSPKGTNDERWFILYKILRTRVVDSGRVPVKVYDVEEVTKFSDGKKRGAAGWTSVIDYYGNISAGYFHDNAVDVYNNMDLINSLPESGAQQLALRKELTYMLDLSKEFAARSLKGRNIAEIEKIYEQVAFDEVNEYLRESGPDNAKNTKEIFYMQLARLQSIINGDPYNVISNLISLAIEMSDNSVYAWNLLARLSGFELPQRSPGVTGLRYENDLWRKLKNDFYDRYEILRGLQYILKKSNPAELRIRAHKIYVELDALREELKEKDSDRTDALKKNLQAHLKLNAGTYFRGLAGAIEARNADGPTGSHELKRLVEMLDLYRRKLWLAEQTAGKAGFEKNVADMEFYAHETAIECDNIIARLSDDDGLLKILRKMRATLAVSRELSASDSTAVEPLLKEYESGQISVTSGLNAGDFSVIANEELLRRALRHLNLEKWNGRVEIHAFADDEGLNIEISGSYPVSMHSIFKTPALSAFDLQILKDTIKSMDGEVIVEEWLGKITKITIRLPKLAAPPSNPRSGTGINAGKTLSVAPVLKELVKTVSDPFSGRAAASEVVETIGSNMDDDLTQGMVSLFVSEDGGLVENSVSNVARDGERAVGVAMLNGWANDVAEFKNREESSSLTLALEGGINAVVKLHFKPVAAGDNRGLVLYVSRPEAGSGENSAEAEERLNSMGERALLAAVAEALIAEKRGGAYEDAFSRYGLGGRVWSVFSGDDGLNARLGAIVADIENPADRQIVYRTVKSEFERQYIVEAAKQAFNENMRAFKDWEKQKAERTAAARQQKAVIIGDIENPAKHAAQARRDGISLRIVSQSAGQKLSPEAKEIIRQGGEYAEMIEPVTSSNMNDLEQTVIYWLEQANAVYIDLTQLSKDEAGDWLGSLKQKIEKAVLAERLKPGFAVMIVANAEIAGVVNAYRQYGFEYYARTSEALPAEQAKQMSETEIMSELKNLKDSLNANLLVDVAVYGEQAAKVTGAMLKAAPENAAMKFEGRVAYSDAASGTAGLARFLDLVRRWAPLVPVVSMEKLFNEQMAIGRKIEISEAGFNGLFEKISVNISGREFSGPAAWAMMDIINEATAAGDNFDLTGSLNALSQAAGKLELSGRIRELTAAVNAETDARIVKMRLGAIGGLLCGALAAGFVRRSGIDVPADKSDMLAALENSLVELSRNLIYNDERFSINPEIGAEKLLETMPAMLYLLKTEQRPELVRDILINYPGKNEQVKNAVERSLDNRLVRALKNDFRGIGGVLDYEHCPAGEVNLCILKSAKTLMPGAAARRPQETAAAVLLVIETLLIDRVKDINSASGAMQLGGVRAYELVLCSQ